MPAWSNEDDRRFFSTLGLLRKRVRISSIFRMPGGVTSAWGNILTTRECIQWETGAQLLYALTLPISDPPARPRHPRRIYFGATMDYRYEDLKMSALYGIILVSVDISQLPLSKNATVHSFEVSGRPGDRFEHEV